MESVILSGPSECKIRRKYPLPSGYEENYDNFGDPFFQGDPMGVPEEEEEESDPYFVWRRNAPFVYDSVSVYNLNWPSLVVEFMEDSSSLRVKNGLATQRLLLGTHTSGTETEFAMIAELRTSLYSLKENMTSCENYNNFVSARKRENGPVLPNSPNLDVIAKIVHPGEINRISHAPKINFSFLTQSNNGTLYMFDYTKHHSNPRELNNSYPQLVLGNGHSSEGYGLSWNSSMKLASCASDGTLCLWDLNSTPATVTKDFSGVVDNVSVLTPLTTYVNNSDYGFSTSYKPKHNSNNTRNNNYNNNNNSTSSKTKTSYNYENPYELSYPSTMGSDTEYNVNGDDNMVLTFSQDVNVTDNNGVNGDLNNNTYNNNSNSNTNTTTGSNGNTNLEKVELYQKMDSSLLVSTQYEQSQYTNSQSNTNNGLNDVEFLYNDDNVVLTASDDGNVYMVDFRTLSNLLNSNNTSGLGRYNSSYNSSYNYGLGNNSGLGNYSGNCMNSVVLVDSGVNTLSVNTYNTNYFVCGCENGNIYLFDLRLPNKYLLLLDQHKESVSQVEFNRNCCGLFASCSNDSTVCIFDLACRGQELRFVHQGHKAQVNDISWSKLNHVQSGQLGFTLASVAQDNLLQCFTPNYFSL